DLIGEGVDVAIRIRERLDTDGDLQMRRIGISRRILVAHRNLLKTYVPPEAPDDPRRFPIIHASEHLGPLTWDLSGPAGRTASVPFGPQGSAGDFAILLYAAIAGCGAA